MNELLPTAAPVRRFLDWPVATDPAEWSADVALIGIQHSEPYAHDPRPNDQARAPDAIRLRSEQISYGRDQWDFDSTLRLARYCRAASTWETLPGPAAVTTNSAAISARVRHLWRQGAQIFALGGDHGVTIPVLDALDAVGETVHVFHVDAHLDWRKEVGGVPRGYSSPLRWASGKPQVAGMTRSGCARQAVLGPEVEAARATARMSSRPRCCTRKAGSRCWRRSRRAAPYTSRSMRTGWTPPRCRRSWPLHRGAYSTARSPRSCGASPARTAWSAWTWSRSRRAMTARTDHGDHGRKACDEVLVPRGLRTGRCAGAK